MHTVHKQGYHCALADSWPIASVAYITRARLSHRPRPTIPFPPVPIIQRKYAHTSFYVWSNKSERIIFEEGICPTQSHALSLSLVNRILLLMPSSSPSAASKDHRVARTAVVFVWIVHGWHLTLRCCSDVRPAYGVHLPEEQVGSKPSTSMHDAS